MAQRMGPNRLRVRAEEFLAVKQNQRRVIAVLGVVEVCLVAGIVLMLLGMKGRLALGLFAAPSPTPICREAALTIASTRFPVKQIKVAPGAELKLPAEPAGTAFWVNDQAAVPLFGFNPEPAVLALLGGLKPGDALRVVWADCKMDDFIVQSVSSGADSAALASPSAAGVRIFVPAAAGVPGMLVEGVTPSALHLPQVAACSGATLALGPARFTIRELAPDASGAFAFPAGEPGVVSRLKGAWGGSVFALEPSAENLALAGTLKAGDLAAVIPCGGSETSFTLAAPEIGATFDPAWLVSDVGELVVYTPDAPAGSGFVLRGGPVVEQVVPTSAPLESGADVQAEITLLDSAAAPDGSTITARVTINNYGAAPFTVTGGDVALAAEGGAPQSPQSADPPLPFELKPGATQLFTFTFAPAPRLPATLRVFTAEVEVK